MARNLRKQGSNPSRTYESLADASNTVTISKEEYDILRNRISELNSVNQEQERRLREKEAELEEIMALLESERAKNQAVITWEADEVSFHKTVMDMCKVEEDCDDDSDHSDLTVMLNEVTSCLMKQNTELKAARLRAFKLHQKANMLAERCANLEKSQSKQVVVSTADLKARSELSVEKYPIQCSEGYSSARHPVVMGRDQDTEMSAIDRKYASRSDRLQSDCVSLCSSHRHSMNHYTGIIVQ